MNELQKVEFDMLKEVLKICDELNLNYYLVCGSALGAVKYSGFIPWDDDMDIGLMRDEYEVFIKNAQEMLPKHLFLQNHITDPQYPHVFSKIRNSETTYIEKSVAKLPINHGVYIDVFPLDGYPDSENEQITFEQKKLVYQRKLSCVYDVNRNFKSKVGMHLRRLCGYHKKTSQIIEKYTYEMKKYSAVKSALICNHGNWQGKLEYAPREQYGNGVMMKFEGLDVRVPERYDEYLTQKYGDWRADLPEEQKVGHHYAKVIDLTKPYTEYMKGRV